MGMTGPLSSMCLSGCWACHGHQLGPSGLSVPSEGFFRLRVIARPMGG